MTEDDPMSSEWHFQTPKMFIQHLIEHGFSRHRPVSRFEDYEVHELDLTLLKLNVSFLTPFIIPKHLTDPDGVTSAHIKHLWRSVERASKGRRKFTIILAHGRVRPSDSDQTLTEFGEEGVTVWDQMTIQAIADTAGPHEKLRLMGKKLVEAFGRESLSPYVSGRPAVGGRFFGRTHQVRHILADDSNCTILGNRRIGKTSLLKEINERLKLKGFRTAEVYGATCHTTEDFVVKLLGELGEFQKQQQVIRNPYHATSLPRWLKQIAVKGPVAVFVDELDHMLEFDAQQEYTLMNMLREISESNEQCRVFFAGFRRVMSEREMVSSPLFNFTRPIYLGGFSREETYEMVVRPLSHLGIDVTHTDLPPHIHASTAGHPEHIQVFCAELIRSYEETHKLPQEAELITRVMDSPQYKQKVMGAFLSNTNLFEELLCYLLMEESINSGQHQWYEFRPADVDRVFKTVGVMIPLRGIMSMMKNLSVSGITKIIPGAGAENYRFSSPLLIEYLRELNLKFCIEKALERIRQLGLNVYDSDRADYDPSTEA
jgi:hypothetical protein